MKDYSYCNKHKNNSTFFFCPTAASLGEMECFACTHKSVQDNAGEQNVTYVSHTERSWGRFTETQ